MTTTTIPDFIEATGLEMTCEWADENPHMSDMPVGSSHWLCTIRRGDASMDVHFSMGPAHTSEPDLESVLDAIASDISSVRNAPDWLDWADEFGFEGAEQLRRARSAHEAITRQSEELGAMLSDEEMEALLWNTERL